jgi:hypothetical protein
MIQDGSGWLWNGSGKFKIVQDASRWYRIIGKVRNRQRWIFVVQKEYSGGQLVCIAFLV